VVGVSAPAREQRLIELNARAVVGKTTLSVPRLGVGTAPLGNMFKAQTDAQADAVLASAVAHGLRYFDTAPLYGHGLAEQRVGRAVAGVARDEIIVSTKVGRLLRADAPRDESQFYMGEPFYRDVPPVGPVWDFSYDGIMTSVDESCQRTGLDRFDVLLLHDPDNHLAEASTTGYRALAELRSSGTTRAIGAGMNQAPVLSRLVERCDLDILLVAGRYTLFDQVAMDELLPLCEERTISIVVGGVFNSGLLIDPSPGARYNYVPASPEDLARAQRIKGICDEYGVPLPAAALQFPFAHPRVCTVLLGFRSIDQLEKNLEWLDAPIPTELWADLKNKGLLRGDAPTPS
jgi:D-threo-aldose 1-dehydrogenase